MQTYKSQCLNTEAYGTKYTHSPVNNMVRLPYRVNYSYNSTMESQASSASLWLQVDQHEMDVFNVVPDKGYFVFVLDVDFNSNNKTAHAIFHNTSSGPYEQLMQNIKEWLQGQTKKCFQFGERQ